MQINNVVKKEILRIRIIFYVKINKNMANSRRNNLPQGNKQQDNRQNSPNKECQTSTGTFSFASLIA